jgi:hypothetical protein
VVLIARGKEPPYTLGVPHSRPVRFGGEKESNLLFLPGFEPRFVGWQPVARSVPARVIRRTTPAGPLCGPMSEGRAVAMPGAQPYAVVTVMFG